jgi:hypothetical protein
MSLTFHLAGINNQNFLMRDEETGTFWQQVSGKAISGPLRGQQLKLVLSDELSFSTWNAEEPEGTVLRSMSQYAADYETKDWDVRMARTASVIQFREKGMQPRDLILGIQTPDASRAFIYTQVIREKLVKSRVGAEPVLLVTGPDDQSVRAFRDRIPRTDAEPDFYRIPGNKPGVLMIDAPTGSEWNFQGCAVSGKAKGVCLERIPMVKDYWFDWRNNNPQTTIWRQR